MSDYLDLGLSSPYLNVSGFLGFNPSKQLEQYDFLGGWITPGVSYRRRQPALDRMVYQFPGGVLIHNGIPNPGFTQVIKEHKSTWRRIVIPTWVHILADSHDHVAQIVGRLEEMDCVAAIELGFTQDIQPDEIKTICSAAVGKIPTVIELPIDFPDFSLFDHMELPNLLALSLCASRGSCFTEEKLLANGRLYGPALFPQSLTALEKALNQSLPIILSGGIDSFSKARQALKIGASAVKFDLPLWTGYLPEKED